MLTKYPQKRMLIQAYLKSNLGDDLFIRTLCQQMPEVQFYLVGGEKCDHFDDIQNLRYVSSDSWFMNLVFKSVNGLIKASNRILHLKLNNIIRENRISDFLLKRLNGMIYISGSVFMENDDFSFDSVKYQNDEWIFSKAPYAIGVNFGPYKTELFRERYEKLLATAKMVSFRDRYSYELFRGKVKNIRYSPDLVFSYSPPECKANKKNAVFISVMDINKQNNNCKRFSSEYNNAILGLCKGYLEKNINVILCGFCDVLGDYEYAKWIQKMLNSEKVEIMCYPMESVDKIVSAMTACKYGVIATRHHSMILALLLQCPVFTIAYNTKMSNCLHDMQIPEISWTDLQNLNRICYESVSQNMYVIPKERLESLKECSNSVFEAVQRSIKQDGGL